MASKDNHLSTGRQNFSSRDQSHNLKSNTFEQAAARLRERLLHIPSYAEKDRTLGMAFWRDLHASAPLYDG